MIEDEQPLFGKRGQELNGKERIAGRLFMEQARQRGGTLRLAAKRIPNQLLQVLRGQWRKNDLVHRRPRLAYRFEPAH